jgi:hypothetical protein
VKEGFSLFKSWRFARRVDRQKKDDVEVEKDKGERRRRRRRRREEGGWDTEHSLTHTTRLPNLTRGRVGWGGGGAGPKKTLQLGTALPAGKTWRGHRGHGHACVHMHAHARSRLSYPRQGRGNVLAGTEENFWGGAMSGSMLQPVAGHWGRQGCTNTNTSTRASEQNTDYREKGQTPRQSPHTGQKMMQQ